MTISGYARRAFINVTYNKVDITEALRKYIKSVEYTDTLSGSADDLQLTMEDRAGLWLAEWFPDKGATLQASIVTKYWDTPTAADKELPLGLFEIDEVECRAMPSEVTIKAVSVPNNTTLRGTEHTKAWEQYTVQKIAKDIADNAGLELMYKSDDNPVLERVEQTEQSDLGFLNKLCKDNGLSLKVTDKQLVIFDLAELEKEKPVLLLRRPIVNGSSLPEKDIKILTPSSWDFSSGTRDTYKACRVMYTNPKTKETIDYTFTDSGKTEGKTLLVKEEVKTIGEAEKRAKKALREKNSEEIKGAFTCMGDTDISAGLTILVEGFGHFDGKYIIKQVSHSLGNGYTCSVTIRKCLDGY